MKLTRKYVIMLDRAQPRQIQRAHEAIKQANSGWWHHFAAVWIVSGSSASKWRDLVKEAISPSGQTSILVMRLPDEREERAWAAAGPNAAVKTSWLKRVYSATTPEPS